MPELPEVETVVRSIRGSLCGRRITAIDLRRPDIVHPVGLDLAAQLAGRSIHDIVRRAKRIVFALDNGHCFYIHLGMTGQLFLFSSSVHPSSPLAAPPPLPPHTHLIIYCGPIELRFRDPRRFGGLFWLANRNPGEDLGPEPLALRQGQLLGLLQHTRRPVKTALLDQTIIAGIGNIYADETLFSAGIHPRTPANKLNAQQATSLTRCIKDILRRAILHGGSSIRDYRDGAGNAGGFQDHHRVYGRTGQPCARCGGRISRMVLGGRSTHFCPRCQKRGR